LQLPSRIIEVGKITNVTWAKKMGEINLKARDIYV
jgi:hypothetical protein